MATTRQSQSEDGSLDGDLLDALRYYLGSRRGLLVLAGLVIAASLALNWSWLAAAGVAPILISVLPCLAMCALGLCMNRSGGKSCSTAASKSDPAAIEDAGPDTQAEGCNRMMQSMSHDGSERPNEQWHAKSPDRNVVPETND